MLHIRFWIIKNITYLVHEEPLWCISNVIIMSGKSVHPIFAVYHIWYNRTERVHNHTALKCDISPLSYTCSPIHMITHYIDYKMPTSYSIKYIPHTCCIKFMWLYTKKQYIPARVKVKGHVKKYHAHAFFWIMLQKFFINNKRLPAEFRGEIYYARCMIIIGKAVYSNTIYGCYC